MSIALKRNAESVSGGDDLTLQLRRGKLLGPRGSPSPPNDSNHSDWVKLNLIKLLEAGGLELYTSVLLDYLQRYNLEPLLSRFKAAFLDKQKPTRARKLRLQTSQDETDSERETTASRTEGAGLVRLIETTLERERYFQFERTKKRLAIVELGNKADLVFKILCTINGLAPSEKWLEDWSGREKQIFWLFMRRMWRLSLSWRAELQRSSEFPKKRGELGNHDCGTFSKHHHQVKQITRSLIKALVVHENRGGGARFVTFAEIVGKLPCAAALRKKAQATLETHFDIDEASNRYTMKSGGHLKKQDVIALLNLLGRHSHIWAVYSEVRGKYLSEHTFSNAQLEHIHRQILEGVDILNNEITRGRLPRSGLELDPAQAKILQRFHVSKSLAAWRFCFDVVALFLDWK